MKVKMSFFLAVALAAGMAKVLPLFAMGVPFTLKMRCWPSGLLPL